MRIGLAQATLSPTTTPSRVLKKIPVNKGWGLNLVGRYGVFPLTWGEGSCNPCDPCDPCDPCNPCAPCKKNKSRPRCKNPYC